MLFRRALWRAGVRGYRVQTRLPGRPDITFPALRLVVFVNGCFWHRCPACQPRLPAANAEFWSTKFRDNLRRDAKARSMLAAAGWDVVTVWEHEIRPDPTRRALELADFIVRRRGRLRLHADA
jgi:DNA mismatch endonuclease (patch repair protein)